MNLLITYDVATESRAGRRRLRRVARACQDFGQRVQKSVFEISVSPMQKEILMARLLEEIEPSEDSLRVYTLPGERERLVETYGLDAYIDFSAPLAI